MTDLKEPKIQRFARWVSIGGSLDHPKFGVLFALVAVARGNGMKCIVGFKPSMHFWYEIGLAGTATQMKATEEKWHTAGHKVKSRKPPGAFGFNLEAPESAWYEADMVKRLAHGCYGGSCPTCDGGTP